MRLYLESPYISSKPLCMLHKNELARQPMSSKDEPRSSSSVHRLEVVVKELVLRGGGVKEMFSTHQHKVGTAIVKPIPGENTKTCV